MRIPVLAALIVALAAWTGGARSLKEHAVESVGGTAVKSGPVVNGPDAVRDADDAGPCAMWAEGCVGPKAVQFQGTGKVTPINTGFLALGSAGTKGSVDGPGAVANGTYVVDENSPYRVSLTIKTGRMDAQLTLERDPATGSDTVRRKGKIWKKGAFTPYGEVSFPGRIVYDAGRDSGTISWTEDAVAKQEGYWNGASGAAMTIELGGGWDHDFSHP